MTISAEERAHQISLALDKVGMHISHIHTTGIANDIRKAETSARAAGFEEGLGESIAICKTQIESLMEGIMTDAGLSKTDKQAMNHQINALDDSVADIRALSPSPEPTNTSISDRLAKALRHLFTQYDEENGVIDVAPEGSCLECTGGTTPDKYNKGPCAFHAARQALAAYDSGEPSQDQAETIRNYLWSRDNQLLAGDGPARDTHEGCEKALRDVYLMSCGDVPEHHPQVDWQSIAEELAEACTEFVRKVEAGEARSTKSYQQMKAALSRARGETQ